MGYEKVIKGPYLPNLEAIEAMGINPKTGLPYKFGGNPTHTKENVQKLLRLNDQACFVNRFQWHNLPRGLDSQDLERMLYYKGQICIFWEKTLNKFFATPFALEGPIDIYGRPTLVHPIPFVMGNAQDAKANVKDISNWLSQKKLKVLWDLPLFSEIVADPSMMENCCVIIQDYTPQISQTILPRQTVNEGLIDIEADMIPFMRTALLNATGVKGMRVNNEDESAQVYLASQSINNASLNGEKFVAMIGKQDFQDFTDSSPVRAEEFLLAMQSLDNIRIGALGLESGGIFQKKAHELQTEADMATNTTNLILNDCLTQRQKKADIMTILWGQPVSVSINEPVSLVDENMDGKLNSSTDAQNQQQAMEMEVSNDDA